MRLVRSVQIRFLDSRFSRIGTPFRSEQASGLDAADLFIFPDFKPRNRLASAFCWHSRCSVSRRVNLGYDWCWWTPRVYDGESNCLRNRVCLDRPISNRNSQIKASRGITTRSGESYTKGGGEGPWVLEASAPLHLATRISRSPRQTFLAAELDRPWNFQLAPVDTYPSVASLKAVTWGGKEGCCRRQPFGQR